VAKPKLKEGFALKVSVEQFYAGCQHNVLKREAYAYKHHGETSKGYTRVTYCLPCAIKENVDVVAGMKIPKAKEESSG
jgi:hypothetical protein